MPHRIFSYLVIKPLAKRQKEGRPVENEVYRLQVLLLTVLMFFAFSMLLARLFYVQVLQGKHFESLALNNKEQTITVPADRGEIFLRDGKKRVVRNETSFSLFIIPNNFPKEPERSVLVEKVAHVFGIDTNAVWQSLKTGRWNPYRQRLIAEGIGREKVFYLAEHLEDFPGLSYEHTPKRVYEDGLVFSHITGYVRGITSKEFEEKSHQGYHRNSLVGVKGVEAQYDLELRGQDGYKVQTVDARNRVKSENQPEGGEPVPGNDLILTIDERIQKIVYDMMQGYPGGAIVTKVSTGEVLGMYSYPSYDPNIFIGNFDQAKYDFYAKDPDLPFLNRVIQGEYPPSSVFKIIVSSAALSDDEVDFYRDVDYCAGGISIGPQFYKCEGWHNQENMLSGFAQSCNVYYYNVGLKIGSEKVIKWAHDYFNLGKATGIDLPYEKKGRVPTHRWKSEVMGTFWWDGDTANLAIGQGYLLATIIQLNTVTAAMAGNGIAYQPHLMKSIRSVIDGKDIYVNPKVASIELPLDKEKIKNIQKAMRAVVQWGTAARAAGGSKLAIAGKTGTAQNVQGNAHAWFTCYAPFNAEKVEDMVAVTVFVEHGGHGGAMSAPFATAILESIFYKNDVRFNYKRIMQNWEGRRSQYEDWLMKRREGGLKELDPPKRNAEGDTITD